MAPHSAPVEPDDPTELVGRPDELESRRPPPLRTLLERLADSRASQLQLPSLRSSSPRRLAVVGLLVALVVVGGWVLLRRPRAVAVENVLPRASTSAAPVATAMSPNGPAAAGAPSSTASPNATVVVHVAGAVRSPGLRTLTGSPRVADALAAAGGAANDADVDRLNLAAPVADGERVYVPRRGETTEPQVVGPTGPSGSDRDDAGPVDLNSATADELEDLPGIGPATASAIVTYRDQHGGFHSVDDLEDVRGIGDAKMEQLRPLVTVQP